MQAGDWVVAKHGRVAHLVDMHRVGLACGSRWFFEWERRPATDADPRCKRCEREAEKKAKEFAQTR